MSGGSAPRHSILTKQKMSNTRKGKHPSWATEASRSEESRKKRSESLLKIGSDKWTVESRNNARTGASKRMKQIVDQNGVTYESIASAARITGCSRSAIQQNLRGELKRTGNKDRVFFIFKHV